MKVSVKIVTDADVSMAVIADELRIMSDEGITFEAIGNTSVKRKFIDPNTGVNKILRVRARVYDPTQYAKEPDEEESNRSEGKSGSAPASIRKSEKILKHLEEEAIVEGLPKDKKYVKF